MRFGHDEVYSLFLHGLVSLELFIVFVSRCSSQTSLLDGFLGRVVDLTTSSTSSRRGGNDVAWVYLIDLKFVLKYESEKGESAGSNESNQGIKTHIIVVFFVFILIILIIIVVIIVIVCEEKGSESEIRQLQSRVLLTLLYSLTCRRLSSFAFSFTL